MEKLHFISNPSQKYHYHEIAKSRRSAGVEPGEEWVQSTGNQQKKKGLDMMRMLNKQDRERR